MIISSHWKSCLQWLQADIIGISIHLEDIWMCHLITVLWDYVSSVGEYKSVLNLCAYVGVLITKEDKRIDIWAKGRKQNEQEWHSKWHDVTVSMNYFFILYSNRGCENIGISMDLLEEPTRGWNEDKEAKLRTELCSSSLVSDLNRASHTQQQWGLLTSICIDF